MGKKEKNQLKNEEEFQIFISGIPYQCTEENLSSFIDSTQIIDIKMPRYQDTGRSRGYAHLKVSSKESYESILAKNGQYLGDRYLTITAAKGLKKKEEANIPVGCKVLFVKNLPYEITEKELRDEFKSCGEINDIRMVRNWTNKNFKGFAYFDYKEAAGVKKAVKRYHNKEYRGRNLICDGVVTGMKKGFKKRDEKVQEQE